MTRAHRPTGALLAFGAAHLDRIARLDGAPRTASIPGRVRAHAGGAAFNAARHVAAAGALVDLWTPGEIEAVEPAASGVRLHPLGATAGEAPSYTAVLDPEGELVLAVSDMRRYDELHASVPPPAKSAEALLVDANLPAPFLQELADTMSAGTALYAMAVSPTKIGRLLPIAERIDCLFANRAEAEELPPGSLSRFRSVVLTDGPNGLLYIEGETRTAYLVETVRPIDVTGAGDAIAGGFVAARLSGRSIAEALAAAEAAAQRTIMVEGPFPFEENA